MNHPYIKYANKLKFISPLSLYTSPSAVRVTLPLILVMRTTKIENKENLRKLTDHSFSMRGKFSEKLTFLTP